MGEAKTDVLQGTLDLMVLKILEALGPLHGRALQDALSKAREPAATEPGHSVSGAPAFAATRLDQQPVGHVREQSQSQVLSAQPGRPPPTGSGSQKLGRISGVMARLGGL